jgi:hypothetical protein
MLTDDDLVELMESAAAAAPATDPLKIEQFSVATPRRRAMSRRRLATALGAAAAIALVLVVSISALRGTGQSPTFDATATAIGPSTVSSPSTTIVGAPALPGVPTAGGAASAPAAPGATAGADTSSAGFAPAPASGRIESAATVPAVPADSARIVKNGALELRVATGAVTESVNRLSALVTGLGGYVSETRSTASADDNSQASATITVRVPAGSFESLMTEASKLGEARSRTTSGHDVTAQFTDLDAQLTALNTTRDQLLTVLGKADNVNDILAVQDRITTVQTQINQLQGQKKLLDDQASLGTLAVTFLEPGATAAPPKPVSNDRDLGDAWRDARASFVDGIEWIVTASGTAALVLIAALVIGGTGWTALRRLRRRII